MRLVSALLLASLFGTVSWAEVQQPPQLAVVPATAAPGEQVTIEGSGWRPGAQLVARFYEGAAGAGHRDVAVFPSAAMGGVITVESDGRFRALGTVPRTLFGQGSRGNVTVVPGAYSVAVNFAPGIGAAALFTVIGPGFIWGEVFEDLNRNSRRDEGEPPVAGEVRAVFGSPPLDEVRAMTDSRGRYMAGPLRLPAPGSVPVRLFVATPQLLRMDRDPYIALPNARDATRWDLAMVPASLPTPVAVDVIELPGPAAAPPTPAGEAAALPETPAALPRTGRRE